MPLSTLTLNCHGLPFTKRRHRFKQIKKLISSVSPDFVFLQEVFLTTDINLLLPDGYTAKYHSFLAKISGGLITLIKEDIPCEVNFVPYSVQAHTYHQLPDLLLKKGMLVCFLNQTGLTLINTHMVCLYEDSASKYDPVLDDQLQEFCHFIADTKKVLAGGDFNFSPQSTYYEKLKFVLEDVSKHSGFTCVEGKVKLDYVWTKDFDHQSSKVQLLEGINKDTPISDHKGVLVSI